MTDTEWRQVLADVPRTGFIPETIWVEDEQVGGYVAMSRSKEPDRWAAVVAADEPVVTQVDDGRTRPGQVGRSPSSSCSQPSIVASMLDALDVRAGHVVLEIGTGTGWNAALLYGLVGEHGRVISVEIDPAVATRARAALRRAGRAVLVVTADGAGGHPPEAPYDRVISTAAVSYAMPYAWVEQTQPGGLIVTPWGTAYHNGAMLGLRVTEEGAAAGRFCGNLAFMRLRGQRGPTWVDEDLDDAEWSTSAPPACRARHRPRPAPGLAV